MIPNRGSIDEPPFTDPGLFRRGPAQRRRGSGPRLRARCRRQRRGRSYAGRQAIGAWWRETKAKYQHAIEPLEMREMDDVTKVRARVAGQFQGSPATLTFAFRLKGDQITGLEIGA